MGLLKQAVVMICGFILPRYFLLYYGSEVNGLISSMTHFLGFISLLELGIGPVIQANLYKPLAEKDSDAISKIIVSSERFFKRIAYIFLAYICVLMVVFPTVINQNYGFWFSASLLLIVSISTIAQYFFGVTYQLLLNADQKAYIPMSLHIATVIINTVVSIFLIRMGFSIHLVKLSTAAIYVLRPIGQIIYVKRKYKINKKIHLDGEPIQQKWNGFAQHLASVVTTNIDIFLLTFFSLTSVSVYSVYFNVTNGIHTIITTAAIGLEAYLGNIIAKGESTALRNSFERIETIMHVMVSFLFAVTAVLITPFISVYTRGVTDANYNQPLFALLMVLASASQCLKIPYFRIIKASCCFKDTQNGAIISMMLNLIVSIALVIKLGLIGVAIGTVIAMLYHTIYLAWYLRKNIICRSFKYFIRNMIADALTFVGVYLCSKPILLMDVSYIGWIVMAIKVTLIGVAITGLIQGLFHSRELKQMMVIRNN